MIDRIRLQNYKTHASTEVSPGRLTVLVGANGSGKTSVLEGLSLAPALLGAGFSRAFSGPLSAETVCRRGLRWFGLAVEGSQRLDWSVALRASLPRGREPTAEALVIASSGITLSAGSAKLSEAESAGTESVGVKSGFADLHLRHPVVDGIPQAVEGPGLETAAASLQVRTCPPCNWARGVLDDVRSWRGLAEDTAWTSWSGVRALA